jgi:predicted nucleic acid-binding protein
MLASAHQPLRLVLDTNIVVAALLWSGPPRRLIEAAIAGEVELFSSPVLLDELAHTLGYAKFAARIENFGTRIAALVAQYTRWSVWWRRPACRASSPTMPMTITSSRRPWPLAPS